MVARMLIPNCSRQAADSADQTHGARVTRQTAEEGVGRDIDHSVPYHTCTTAGGNEKAQHLYHDINI